MIKSLFKTLIFKYFVVFVDLMGVFESERWTFWVLVYFRNKWEITSQNLRKLGIFLGLARFFQLSLPKIWITQQNLHFGNSKDRAIISQSFQLQMILNFRSIWKLTVFSSISSMNGKKHQVIVACHGNLAKAVTSTWKFFETLKDTPPNVLGM